MLTFVPWEGRAAGSSKTLLRKSSKGRKSKGKGEDGEKKEEKRRKRRRQKRKRGKKGGEEGQVVVHPHEEGDAVGDEEGDGDW